MVSPASSRGPGRRAVLLGAAACAGLLVSGCGIDLDELRRVRLDDDQPLPRPTPGPDELARRAAVEDVDLLRRAAAAATGQGEQQEALLARLVEQHAVQLDALGAADLVVETPTTAAPSEPAPSTPVTLPPLPDLPALEAAAASTALTWVGRTSGAMARLLAALAAAHAVHARRLAAALGQPLPPLPTPLTDASTASGSIRLSDDAAAAVTTALQGEHAAAYAYGFVAARLTDGARAAAVAALAEHEDAVDELSDVLRAEERPVPAAEPAYRLPGPVTAPAEVQALALEVEERLAVLHADVVAAAEGGVRVLAADLLVRTASRAATWRGAAVALPGLRIGS